MIPDKTEEIFNVHNSVIVDGKVISNDYIDPLFEITLRFEDEIKDEGAEQDSLLIIGFGV